MRTLWKCECGFGFAGLIESLIGLTAQHSDAFAAAAHGDTDGENVDDQQMQPVGWARFICPTSVIESRKSAGNPGSGLSLLYCPSFLTEKSTTPVIAGDLF